MPITDATYTEDVPHDELTALANRMLLEFEDEIEGMGVEVIVVVTRGDRGGMGAHGASYSNPLALRPHLRRQLAAINKLDREGF
jgi:hypothetical protein